MNANDLIQEVLNGCAPDQVVARLYEKRQKSAKPRIYYHGTSETAWEHIKRAGGLDPDAEPIWTDEEDEGVRGTVSRQNLTTFGGVYFTPQMEKAGNAGSRSKVRYGDDRQVIIVAQIQPRSAFLDEDVVSPLVVKAADYAIRTTADYYRWKDDHGRRLNEWEALGYWVASYLDNEDPGGGAEFAQDLFDRLDQYAREIEVEPPSDAHPKLYNLLWRLFESHFEIEVLRQVSHTRQRASDYFYGGIYAYHYWDRVENMGWDVSEDDSELEQFIKDELIPETRLDIPSAAEAERDSREGIDRMTRLLKGLSLGKSPDGDLSIRVLDKIDFRGRNKILAVIAFSSPQRGEVIYGKLPSKAKSDAKQLFKQVVDPTEIRRRKREPGIPRQARLFGAA